MFELSGVNYEEVLEQGDSILVRVIASSSYRGLELSGLYCILKQQSVVQYIIHVRSHKIDLFISEKVYCIINPVPGIKPRRKFRVDE